MAVGILLISFIAMVVIALKLLNRNFGGKDSVEMTTVFVNLSQQAMELRTKHVSNLHDYAQINRVELTPTKDIAVVSDIGVALVLIPKSAFESQDHRDFFMATVNALANQTFRPEQVLQPEVIETGNPFQSPTSQPPSDD